MTQVVSKKRVADHGEVYTHSREVNAMLDLVKHETERIDSKFLEPACGNGNFLIEILNRKLLIVSERYSKSQLEFERHAVIAVGSIYGIDLLSDNVQTCQERLFNLFFEQYFSMYNNKIKAELEPAIKFILSKNILHGNALTLETVATENSPPKPIVFSEWTLASGSLIKRRDFVYAHLLDQSSHREMPLFSDLEEEAYIPEPVKDFPLKNFLEIFNE